MKHTRLQLFSTVGLLLLLGSAGSITLAAPRLDPPTVGYRSGWPVDTGRLVDRSSPVVGNLDADNDLEIVVGTSIIYPGTSGRQVYAFNPDGSRVPGWPVAVSAEVNSSPAIGDINGDGWNEVIIGVAWADVQNDGGIYAFSHNGQVLDGWPVRTQDLNLGPDGYPDGVFATPALVDLDGDGLLDVVVGSFDEYLYGLKYDGTAAPGWPFFLWDSTWASPAVGDLDGDGEVEIVATAYTHAGYPIGYPTVDGGGIMWVVDTQGNVEPGWPQIFDLHFDSSPALGDLDGDSDLEIVIGTGQESGTTTGHKVYALHHNGVAVSGWPVSTSDYVWPSPALADLDGDGKYEVIVSCIDGLLYAWDDDGSTFPGSWPVRPLNESGVNGGMVGSPVVADLDNNGDLEILVPIGWDVVGFNHDGSFFRYGAETQLRMHTRYALGSTPAIADIDHNNRLDVIIGSANGDFNQGRLYAWELPAKAVPGEMPWPMWRQNPLRTGQAPRFPFLSVAPTSLVVFHPYGDTVNPVTSLFVRNRGDGEITWSATPGNPTRVSVSPAGGSVSTNAVPIEVTVNLSSLLTGASTLVLTGTYDLGNIVVTGTVESEPAGGSPVTVPATLYVGHAFEIFLPLVIR
jgi:hypothetical protein